MENFNFDNIKEQIESLLAKIKGDDETVSKFKADPVGTVKGLLGKIDIPDDLLDNIIEAIQAKLDDGDDTNDSIADKISGLLDKAKGLFDKKED